MRTRTRTRATDTASRLGRRPPARCVAARCALDWVPCCSRRRSSSTSWPGSVSRSSSSRPSRSTPRTSVSNGASWTSTMTSPSSCSRAPSRVWCDPGRSPTCSSHRRVDVPRIRDAPAAGDVRGRPARPAAGLVAGPASADALPCSGYRCRCVGVSDATPTEVPTPSTRSGRPAAASEDEGPPR